jgi:hypothetical protein
LPLGELLECRLFGQRCVSNTYQLFPILIRLL